MPFPSSRSLSLDPAQTREAAARQACSRRARASCAALRRPPLTASTASPPWPPGSAGEPIRRLEETDGEPIRSPKAIRRRERARATHQPARVPSHPASQAPPRCRLALAIRRPLPRRRLQALGARRLSPPVPASVSAPPRAPFGPPPAREYVPISQIHWNKRGKSYMDIMQTSDSSQYGIVENSPYRIPYDRHTEDVNLGATWYFSRKEIEENSLSRRDGIDLKKESYLRKSYCTYLQELGVRLKVPPVTIATAVVFCHRFFLRQSHARNDRMTIATVCMFLAGKVEETPRPLKDVILISYEVIHKKDPAAVARIKQKEVYEKQKELLLIGERVVLVTLDFDLNVYHPYKPLVQAIEKFNKVAQKALAQAAWSFVNDGLRTSLCLQFKPQHIAAGAIFLATKFLKIKLPADGENFWLQQFDVTPRQLEEVSNQMLELYGPAPAQDSKGSPASVSAPEKAPGAAKEPPAASTPSSMPGRHGPEKQNAKQRIPLNKPRGAMAADNEVPNMSSSTTTANATDKIDKDTVKAVLVKQGNPNGDAGRKVDDDGPVERDLEHAVELAADDEDKVDDRRQTLPSPHGENADGTAEKTEEGEASMDSQYRLSPGLDSRKRKDTQVDTSCDGGESDLKRARS